jgi:hypothetical protein
VHCLSGLEQLTMVIAGHSTDLQSLLTDRNWKAGA